MRGKVTDQDLTNYALNELSPDERLYVESMLGVSEECRHDVYRMLDLSEMLKEGFEEKEEVAELLLNSEQRDRVLTVPRFHWRGLLQRAAAIALLAAGAGYGLSSGDLWRKGSQNLADAKESIGGYMAKMDQNFATTAEQLTARLKQAAQPAEKTEFEFAECTPPVIMADMVGEMPPMPDVGEM